MSSDKSSEVSRVALTQRVSVDRDPRDGMELTPGWADDGRVYVDGRVTRNQARHMVCAETGAWYKTSTARRCYMRLLTEAEAEEATGGEWTEFWWACDKTEPNALAMWVVEAP